MSQSVSTIKPGRETDARIAEAIGWKLLDRVAMGWRDGPPVFSTTDPESPTFQGFEPSCNPAHALAALEATGGHYIIERHPGFDYCTVTCGGFTSSNIDLCTAICAAILQLRGEGK